MTTNDPTSGLTRKQLRELRAAQAAAAEAPEAVPAEPAAEQAAPVSDAATAIPIVKPALTDTRATSPATPVSGIVMHSAPIVRGPLSQAAPLTVGVTQHTQAAAEAAVDEAVQPPVVEPQPADEPTRMGRRALRQSRTGALAEAGAEEPAPEAPLAAVVAPAEATPHVEQAAAEPVTSRMSRRASRTAAPVGTDEPHVTEPETVQHEVPEPERAESDASQAPKAPLLHTEPPLVEGVALNAPVRADGLFATDENGVEPLVEGVAVEPAWQAPVRELAFDDIIAARPRGTGTSASPTTLIFNPGDLQSTLTGPIPSTGELLVTASHAIAPGLASRGHVDGAVDDGSTDAVLLDRELPVASSPTPIAAKSAISRSTAGPELVRPAEPEKTNKLTIALVVTGGLLLVAALTTLIVGLMRGIL